MLTQRVFKVPSIILTVFRMCVSTRTKEERFFIILSVVGLFAILSSTMSKNPVLNPFAKSLNTPDPLLGVVAAASTIPGILISLPAGSLSDIYGKEKTLLVSSILFASAPFLYLFINSWWQLIIVRFYHGFATAIFVPVANAAIAERFPDRKAERISLFSSATIVGRCIAPFLGGYILSVTNYSYHDLYLAVGIAGVTAFLVSLTFFRKTESASFSQLKTLESEKEPLFSAWKEVAGNPGILTVSFVEASQYYTYGAMEFFLVGYLREIAGIDPFLIGVVLGAQLIVIPVAKPFMGRVADKVGRRIPIIAGSVVGAAPLMVIPYVTDFIFLLALSITYGLGFSLVTSATPALVSDQVNDKLYGTAMGFLATIMDVGQVLGPIITGLIIAVSATYRFSFIALAVILLLSCVVYYFTMASSSR